ncbi:MAG: Do family serine endopeptidase [Armatimonadota bacterium]|nr:Do family serine endopeptidase [Armatimonadota bacterium]
MKKTLLRHNQNLSLAIIIGLSIALGFSIAANLYHRSTPAAAVAASESPLPQGWQDAFVLVAEKLRPCIVHITSEKTVEVPSFPWFDDFFWPFGGGRSRPEPEKRVQQATGSGVIVRSDGYILTNNHVVAGADRVTVKLADGREFTGKVLLDPYSDLALVKIDAKDLPAAQFGDSDKVKVGQWVAAIGNPFGLENTVTAGVVSAVRHISSSEDPLPGAEVIQTDASINPGNSGGPLVDLQGRIIGINFTIYTTSGGNVGVGFAIPANIAKNVMTQLIEKGKVVRGYLGVIPRDLTPVLREKLGVQEGALVESVDKDTPAEKAGIKVMDVIVSVNGKPVKDSADLRRIVQSIAPGTKVKVVVVRDKTRKTLDVTISELPVKSASAGGDKATDKIGLSVQPLTRELARQLGLDESVRGVLVRRVEPGSAADRAGIRRNDVIVEIDGNPVDSVASFTKAISKLKSGDTAIVVVQRGDRTQIITLRID